MSELRIGLGVDAHAFEDGLRLVLGGVAIDHPRYFAFIPSAPTPSAPTPPVSAPDGEPPAG